MSRLIDADEFIRRMNEELIPKLIEKYGKEEAYRGLHFSAFDCISNIEAQPTVDAVEVVRCKDCKYSKHLKQYPKVNTWKCTLTDVVYRADDYCNFGERKEDDGN